MARTPKEVTDKELEILQVLWEDGPCTIKHVADRLYPGGGVSKYATVQKLLDRLEQAECVRRERGSGPHIFQAVADRDDLIGRQLRNVAEKLCGGSVTPLLTHLMRARKLSARERAELRALIDELDDSTKKGEKK
jgi:predicted transcriptional regulator